MTFKNNPLNVKGKAGKQTLALAHYRAGSAYNAILVVLSDMNTDQHIQFHLEALKKSKYKIYTLGLVNLENAINNYYKDKDSVKLFRVKRTFEDNTAFGNICCAMLTLIESKEKALKKDYSWISQIGYTIYCIPEDMNGAGHDEGLKSFLADILEYRYNNKNFRLIYGK